MSESEMKNVPPLWGWAIAAGAGAVAFGVSLVLIGIEGNGSVFIGIVVAAVVGIIFTIADRAAPPAKPAGSAPTASVGGAGGSAVASSPAPAAPEAAPAASPAAAAGSASVSAEAAAPAEVAVASSSEAVEGTKPAALAGPQGEKDDLKQISGVGPVLEGKLNDLGIYHFWQIARWSRDEVNWVDGFLNFKGRIDRDDWITQAKSLAETSGAKAPA